MVLVTLSGRMGAEPILPDILLQYKIISGRYYYNIVSKVSVTLSGRLDAEPI